MGEYEADRDGSEGELVSVSVAAALAGRGPLVVSEYQVGGRPGVRQEVEAAPSVESRECLLLCGNKPALATPQVSL